MTPAGTLPVAKAPGPGLRLSIGLLVAGCALAVPTFIAAFVPIVHAVSSPIRFQVPGTTLIHLERGDYMLYEDKGATSFGSSFSGDDSVTITPSDVTVRSLAGTELTVSERGSITETLAVDGRRYVGAVKFSTPEAGQYNVEVQNVAPGSVVVARPFGSIVKSSLGWFALSALGGIVAVTGLVMLIVGSVRRGRARAGPAFVAPPPGWHPDPWGTGRLRYWDGVRWTEHVH